MIPSPTLYKVRNVVKDRRVGLDIVGNVFDSLCGFVADVRRVFRTLDDANEMD
jgi:hypothetical protein